MSIQKEGRKRVEALVESAPQSIAGAARSGWLFYGWLPSPPTSAREKQACFFLFFFVQTFFRSTVHHSLASADLRPQTESQNPSRSKFTLFRARANLTDNVLFLFMYYCTCPGDFCCFGALTM